MLYYKTFKQNNNLDWVVFVHGMGGSSSIFYKQIKAYKEHFNLLFIDLRGHGKSKELEPVDKYTLNAVSEEVIAVLDQLKIKKAHFVGISLGAVIIKTISDLTPQRIKTMVLGGAINRFNLRSKFLIEVGDWIKSFIPYMWLYRFFAWIIMPKNRHKQSRIMFVNEAKRLGQKEFVKWFKLSKEIEAHYHHMKNKLIKVPKLYVMGDEDHLFLTQVKKDINTDQYALLSVINDSGHVCNVDQAQMFNDVTIDFIKNTSARFMSSQVEEVEVNTTSGSKGAS